MNAQNENANINLIECNGYSEMMELVGQSTMSSNVTTTAGTLYKQGGRYCFQTALDLQSLRHLTHANRPGKAKTTSVDDIKDSTNRPLDKKHASQIGSYVADAINNNKPYILPSLTLNFDQVVDVFTIKGSAPTRAAIMVMPIGVQMEVTDGQHRIEGVNGAIQAAVDARHDGIGAMVTFTSEVRQVHQDFADCAKTKPISTSMLAVYDRRNPANGLTLDLIERAPLFKYTIDSAKKSVSAGTLAVWTTNQVRVLVKWATMSKQVSDEVFATESKKLFVERGSPEYEDFLAGLIKAIEIMSENNPVLSQLASLSREQLSQIPEIRETNQSILTSGSGLAVFGYVWYLIRQYKLDNPTVDTGRLVKRLALLDWSATSLLFANNLKINPERISSGQKYVKMAGDTMWNEVQRQEESIAA